MHKAKPLTQGPSHQRTQALQVREEVQRSFAIDFGNRIAKWFELVGRRSFVPAHVLPQLADTAEVVAFARSISNLTVAVLVPNLKGTQAAVSAGAHKTPYRCRSPRVTACATCGALMRRCWRKFAG